MRRVFLRQTFADVSRAALDGIDEALMPRRCAFCGQPLPAAAAQICADCREELPWNRPACMRCAAPLPTELPEGVSCGACRQRPPAWDSAAAPLCWEFPVDAAIRALKFRRRLFYLPAFQSLLLEALPALPAGIDAVQPVPLHRFRRMRRGFNQARELAAPVAEALQVPLCRALLRRRRTRTQSELSAGERRRNLKDAFCLRSAPPGEHVLLVDDVMTTGETLRSAARELRRHGVRRISVLVLARAAGN